jgi:hypothetical protein
MNIRDIIFDLVVENLSREKQLLVDKTIERWLSEDPELSPERAKNLANWFLNAGDKLKRTLRYRATDKDTGETHDYETVRPQVSKFLRRFKDFKESDLTRIESYSAQQIQFLYYEYNFVEDPNREDNVTQNSVFDPKDRKPTDKKREASKELWYDKERAVFSDEGFRVYEIDNQMTSINFGYYLGTLYGNYGYSGGQWCTTWWDSNNFYISKRANRSFYFIIDESKHPEIEKDKETNKFYLGALQIMDPVSSGGRKFKLTDITNPGEPDISLQRLLQIYPKLTPFIEQLKYTPFDESETTTSDVVGRINEIPGNKYEFSTQPRYLQLRYVSRPNSNLQNADSWDHMDTNLKKTYIDSIDRTNYLDKLSSIAILELIKRNVSEKNTLNWKLSQIDSNLSIGSLVLNTLKNHYGIGSRSIKNPKVKLLAHFTNNTYGLFDENTGDWVKRGGNRYVEYYKTDFDIYIDKELNKNYVVEVFTKSGDVDQHSFFRIYEGITIEPKSAKDKTKSYFLSHDKWNELSQKLQIKEGPKHGEFSNVDFDKDSDISENN